MVPPADLRPAAIEAVLCDADGCLFPSEEPAFDASAHVTNEFLAEIGARARFSAEELRLATTGQNFRTTAALLAAEEGISVKPRELERWVEEERRRVTAHLSQTLRPIDAVVEPLTQLGRDRTLAVVTSSALTRVEACLAASGLDDLFPRHARFSAESSLPVPTSKPDPAIYRLAGESLEIAPQQGLAIEDSVPGAESALGAGFPTLGNVAFVPPEEREARVAALEAAGVGGIIESWGDLEQLLEIGSESLASVSLSKQP
jgi:HAD superfamily hydrolase (TIGR01509 family)